MAAIPRCCYTGTLSEKVLGERAYSAVVLYESLVPPVCTHPTETESDDFVNVSLLMDKVASDNDDTTTSAADDYLTN